MQNGSLGMVPHSGNELAGLSLGLHLKWKRYNPWLLYMKQPGSRYYLCIWWSENATDYAYQQNSHSGPGIASIAMFLQNGHWSWNNVSFHQKDLDLACDHKAREEMFRTILHCSHACFHLWEKMSRRNKDWIQVPETLVDELRIPAAHLQWVRNLSLIFINQCSRCKACQVEMGSVHCAVDNIKRPHLPGKNVHLPPKTRTLHLPPPLSVTGMDPPLSPSSKTSDHHIDWGTFDDYSTAPLWSSCSVPWEVVLSLLDE